MMLSVNELIKFMFVDAYFCNSVGLNRKLFNIYKKKALSEEEKPAAVAYYFLYLMYVKIIGVFHDLTFTKSTKWLTMYVPCKHEL